nr:hypothetical protein [Tanacetum cinerariifolium]
MEAYEPEVLKAAPQSPKQAQLSPIPAPKYPKYLAPFDDDIPAEDQPLPADAPPTACSPGYITDSEPIEDYSEEDPEIDYVDYPSDEDEDIIFEADMSLQKRARFTAPSRMFEIGESLTAAAARQPGFALTRGTELDFMTALEVVKESVADMATRHRQDCEEFYTHHQDVQDDKALLQAHISTLAREMRYYYHMAIAETKALQQQRRDDHDMWTRAIRPNRGSGNRHDNHDSGSGERRRVPTSHVCTYNDFLNCQPLNFKGTKEVIGLTQWSEKMESVFHISNCTVENQVKYATYTLLGNAQMWGEIKNLEIEIWNMKESNEVEKYVGGLSNMIQGKVMSARPKIMQEAIELANDLLDQKFRTIVERHVENKRKLDSNPKDNQVQQQPFKRQNVARAYNAGPSEKKEYVGYHCAPSAITITIGRVISSVTTAKGLAIWPMVIELNYKKDCQKLKNKNRGNQVGDGEAHRKAYVLGGGDLNTDSNVVT